MLQTDLAAIHRTSKCCMIFGWPKSEHQTNRGEANANAAVYGEAVHLRYIFVEFAMNFAAQAAHHWKHNYRHIS